MSKSFVNIILDGIAIEWSAVTAAPQHNSSRKAYIEKMGYEEEDKLRKCKEILKKMKKVLVKQTNV